MPATRPKPLPRPAITGDRGLKIVAACTVKKSREELFRFWRRVENLPRFSRQVLAVVETSDTTSHWVVKSDSGTIVEWDLAIINEHENELISWESEPGSEIQNAGTVRFTPAPDDQGTEVTLNFEFVPPGGELGLALARLYGEKPEVEVEDNLLRFKALMETGEIPTTEGQPAGAGRTVKRRAK